MSDGAEDAGEVIPHLLLGPKSPAPTTTSPPCSTCHHFALGLSTSITPSVLLLSANSSCSGCSLLLQVLDAVTDIRRPEFTAIELERNDDPVGVLKIRCTQEGLPTEGMWLDKTFVDPYPNQYQVYTPAGESYHQEYSRSLPSIDA
jgi:hypothetical protein